MLPNAPSAARCALRRPAASPSVSSWIRRSTPLRSLAPHTIASRVGAIASPASPVPLRRPASTAARPRRNVDSPLSRPPPAHPVLSADHASHKPLKRTDIKLRPYQVDCIRAVLDELERGEFSRLGVSAPTGASPWPSPNACCARPDSPYTLTGSGKTAIFTSLISHLPALVHPVTGEVATRVLIIVNSIQLASQTAQAVTRAYPDLVRAWRGGRALRYQCESAAFDAQELTLKAAPTDCRSRAGQESRLGYCRRHRLHLPGALARQPPSRLLSPGSPSPALPASRAPADPRPLFLLAPRKVPPRALQGRHRRRGAPRRRAVVPRDPRPLRLARRARARRCGRRHAARRGERDRARCRGRDGGERARECGRVGRGGRVPCAERGRPAARGRPRRPPRLGPTDPGPAPRQCRLAGPHARPAPGVYGDVGPRGRARSRQSVREDRLARRVAEHDQGQVVCLFSLSDARETLRARLCAGASVVSLESAR